MGISWRRKHFKGRPGPLPTSPGGGSPAHPDLPGGKVASPNPSGGGASPGTRPACLTVELNTSSICALMASPTGEVGRGLSRFCVLDGLPTGKVGRGNSFPYRGKSEGAYNLTLTLSRWRGNSTQGQLKYENDNNTIRFCGLDGLPTGKVGMGF